MIRLTTLASVDLRGPDDTPLRSVLNQPKRLALLAYLALTAKEGPQRRDALIGLFWPESNDEKARNALNQAVFFLRKSLGRDAVVSRGPEDLGVDPASVWCDAVAFETALEDDRPEEALTLYRGDFLRGFFLDDAAEFERWLDTERLRLRERAVRAARELAEREERSGDLRAAVQWARREVELSQEERALRRLIELLDRAGDRAGALHAYETFTQRLAAEFEVEPSPETRRLVEAIRSRQEPRDGESATGPHGESAYGGDSATARRGDAAKPLGGDAARAESSAVAGRDPEAVKRAGAADEAVDAGSSSGDEAAAGSRRDPVHGGPAGAPSGDPVAAGSAAGAPARAPTPRRRRLGPWVVGAIAVAIAAVVAIGVLREPLAWGGRTPIERARPRIAVLPFEDPSGTGRTNYVADGLTSALVAQLSQVRALEIISKDGLRSLGVDGLPRDSIAQALDIDLIVTGTVLQSEGRTRITVHLVDAGSGATLRSIPLERPAGDLFALLDEAAQEVSSALRVQLGREIRLKEWRSGTKDVEAWALLQRAQRRREDAQALQTTGDFTAEASALIAADSLLAVAEARDPNWVDPIILRGAISEDLGWIYFRPALRDRDVHREYWEIGIEHANRALKIDPRNAAALELRGLLRQRIAMMAAPSADSSAALRRLAEHDFRAAVASDDGRAVAWNSLSHILFTRGEFAEAKVAAERAYEADAYLENAKEILSRLVTASLEVGADSEAVKWCDEIERRFGNYWTEALCRLSILALSEQAPATTPTDVQRTIAETEIESYIRPFVEPQLQILGATALARNGYASEAEALISTARQLSTGSDPELLRLEAMARVFLGQQDSAIALLNDYIRAKPSGHLGVLGGRVFSSLTGLPPLVETELND